MFSNAINSLRSFAQRNPSKAFYTAGVGDGLVIGAVTVALIFWISGR